MVTTLIQPKPASGQTVYFHRVFIAGVRPDQVLVIERTGVQTADTDIVNENRRYTLSPAQARAEFARLRNAGFIQV